LLLLSLLFLAHLAKGNDQKQELPMVAMFVDGSRQNEQI
jgi:hypothetical protein